VQTALSYVQCFDTIPACDRRTYGWTDGQTDGTAVVTTALAMRALRRAVKKANELKTKPISSED